MKTSKFHDNFTRRVLVPLMLFACLVSGCASDASLSEPDLRKLLAPSGRLRVGLYPGTPTSLLTADVSENSRGVGHDLGRALAQRLGVPFEPVVLTNNAEVIAAVKSGIVDIAFTNATADRALEIDFSPVCLEIELGFLVRSGSPVTAVANVDRPGIRVGVTAKSSSEAKLTHEFKQAKVVGEATVRTGIAMLAAGAIDVYATNKPTLYEMSDSLPGSRVLDGRWGSERMALAVPKGRDAGHYLLRRFVASAKDEGLIESAIKRAGLRGVVESKPAATGSGDRRK